MIAGRLVGSRSLAHNGAALLLAALVASPPVTAAPELSIEATPCAQQIRIRAKDVAIDDIVGGLAKAMDLRLVARTSLPEPITFDGTGTPEEVLKRLLHGKNLVIETRRKSACGPREVLATVWLLPSGQDGPARASASIPEASPEPHGTPTLRTGRQGGHPMTAAERKQMRQQWRQQQRDAASPSPDRVPEQDPRTSDEVPPADER